MITLRQLIAAIAKETHLIVRDWQALVVLFVMPVVFVAIMSLALRDVFNEHAGVTFSMLIVDQDGKLVGQQLREAFAGDKHFRVELAAAPFPDAAEVETRLTAGHYRFALLIPARTTAQARQRALEQINADSAARGHTLPVSVRLLADPTLGYVSRYALGRDYHKLIRPRLARLADQLAAAVGAGATAPSASSSGSSAGTTSTGRAP